MEDMKTDVRSDENSSAWSFEDQSVWDGMVNQGPIVFSDLVPDNIEKAFDAGMEADDALIEFGGDYYESMNNWECNKEADTLGVSELLLS
mgnify:FL=1|jgi:hypothetical protein